MADSSWQNLLKEGVMDFKCIRELNPELVCIRNYRAKTTHNEIYLSAIIRIS